MSTLHLTDPPTEVGCSIPPNTPHAISVNLPNWQDNIDYEEGHERVISRLSTGYPRFFIHNQIKKVKHSFPFLFWVKGNEYLQFCIVLFIYFF
jgi:cystathionine gamma-synthase